MCAGWRWRWRRIDRSGGRGAPWRFAGPLDMAKRGTRRGFGPDLRGFAASLGKFSRPTFPGEMARDPACRVSERPPRLRPGNLAMDGPLRAGVRRPAVPPGRPRLRGGCRPPVRAGRLWGRRCVACPATPARMRDGSVVATCKAMHAELAGSFERSRRRIVMRLFGLSRISLCAMCCMKRCWRAMKGQLGPGVEAGSCFDA